MRKETLDPANPSLTPNLQRARRAELERLAPLVEQARDYQEQARARNTLRAYRADWADFSAWCAEHGLAALPAEPGTVALYLTARAETHRPATLQRRLATIAQAHAAAGLETPTRAAAVRSVWKGIRNVKGVAQRGKSPTLPPALRAMLETLEPGTLAGARDRALLLLGFAGAFRRSELVSLNCEDLAFTIEGCVVALRRSKTDQEGEGAKRGIPFGLRPARCPVRALTRWLELAGITSGPLFRPINRHGQLRGTRLSDRTVALVVKRCAERAGLEPEHYAGHSLRAGLATSAAAAGASERSIMNQTGHKSAAMVRRYIRDGELFRDNAAGAVEL